MERHINREGWEAGEWDNEPDRVEFRYAGFPCLIVRSELAGALCGYVGVSSDHPWYQRHYNFIDANVHGGLTYSNMCGGHVCHVPEPGESDHVWWLGFDCSHAFDYAPTMGSFGLLIEGAEYRNIAYVRAEVEKLAEQARATAQGKGSPLTSDTAEATQRGHSDLLP